MLTDANASRALMQWKRDTARTALGAGKATIGMDGVNAQTALPAMPPAVQRWMDEVSTLTGLPCQHRARRQSVAA
jgi:hypothetical protein